MLSRSYLIVPAIAILALSVNAGAAQPAGDPPAKHIIREPAATIPKLTGSTKRRVDLAFLFNHDMFDLKSGCFYRLLFDTPKAVLFRYPANYYSEDDYYFYYRDAKFDAYLAFGKHPKDHFAGHAIWSRRDGSTSWDLLTEEAIMAGPR